MISFLNVYWNMYSYCPERMTTFFRVASFFRIIVIQSFVAAAILLKELMTTCCLLLPHHIPIIKWNIFHHLLAPQRCSLPQPSSDSQPNRSLIAPGSHIHLLGLFENIFNIVESTCFCYCPEINGDHLVKGRFFLTECQDKTSEVDWWAATLFTSNTSSILVINLGWGWNPS